jgi:hypothetical protein
MEEIEQKTKELLWEGIAALNQQIKEEKALKKKLLGDIYDNNSNT